eukprot:jgi/Chrpa1/476/Chrysochromulina_OHIO_Genome00011058-RA
MSRSSTTKAESGPPSVKHSTNTQKTSLQISAKSTATETTYCEHSPGTTREYRRRSTLRGRTAINEGLQLDCMPTGRAAQGL